MNVKTRVLVPAVTSIVFLRPNLFPCKRKSYTLPRLTYSTYPLPLKDAISALPKPWTPLAKATSKAPIQFWLRFRSPPPHKIPRPHEVSRARAPYSHRGDRIGVTPDCSLWGWCSPMLLIQIVLGGNKVLVGLKF